MPSAKTCKGGFAHRRREERERHSFLLRFPRSSVDEPAQRGCQLSELRSRLCGHLFISSAQFIFLFPRPPAPPPCRVPYASTCPTCGGAGGSDGRSGRCRQAAASVTAGAHSALVVGRKPLSARRVSFRGRAQVCVCVSAERRGCARDHTRSCVLLLFGVGCVVCCRRCATRFSKRKNSASAPCVSASTGTKDSRWRQGLNLRASTTGAAGLSFL